MIMNERILLATLSLCLTLPAQAALNNAEEILEAMMDKRQELWSDLGPRKEGLIICKTVMDNKTVAYMEPVKSEHAWVMRQVPPQEMQMRIEADEGMTPERKRAFAEGYVEGMEMLVEGLRSELGSNPEIDGALFMGMMGLDSFMDAAAPSQADIARMKAAEAANKQDMVMDYAQFMGTARLVGRETVEGREAYHLRSTDAGDEVQQNGDIRFTPKSADLWIDVEELVELKMKVVGDVEGNGQEREMFFELVNSDFDHVGDLFEPRRQVMRMGGVLSPQEEAQLEEAQAQMAEVRAQMDALPPAQKAMMERMMGDKLKMLENMAQTGGIETETRVVDWMIGGTQDYARLFLECAAGVPLDPSAWE